MKLIALINKILPYFKKPSDISVFHNILVVSNTGLGDTLLSTPAIISLRRSFPTLNITFLIHKKMFPLFKDFVYVNDLEIYSPGFFNQISTVFKLRRRDIDTIFLFHSNGPEDVFFSILSGAKNIFKMTDNLNHEYKKIFSNQPNIKCQHDIEKKLDLVRVFNPKVLFKKLVIPNGFYESFGFFKKNEEYIYIGFQIGAQEDYKIWPIKNFAYLANKLSKVSTKFKFVLMGSTIYERKLAEEFCCILENSENIINLCGKSSIDELPSIINDLDLLVSNDTGTLHLAIALGKKTVSLFGPTSQNEFGPYQDYNIHQVINTGSPKFVKDRQKDFRKQNSMTNINIDDVYYAINRLI